MSAKTGDLASLSSKSIDKTKRQPSNKVQATPEQIRLAQISQKPEQADDLSSKVAMVATAASCSSDDAVFALHDCGNDVQQAVNMLLEMGESEWHQQVTKKRKGSRLGSGDAAFSAESQDGLTLANASKEIWDSPADRDRPGFGRGRSHPPPRMQRGGFFPSGRGRLEYAPREDDKENANDFEADGVVQSQRGRGRGGWRGSRGGRGNYGRPSRFERDGSSASGGASVNVAEPGAADGGANEHTSENWELDEWTGSLKESQVFTARAAALELSASLASAAAADGEANSAVDSLSQPCVSADHGPGGLLVDGAEVASLIALRLGTNTLLAKPDHQTTGEDNQLHPKSQQLAAATTPLASADVYMTVTSMYDRQLASDTIKHAIGMPTSHQSLAATSTSSAGVVRAGFVQQQQALPQKAKSSRSKLPPPTKIPTAAVEMPHMANSAGAVVQTLGVQFGSLDLTAEGANLSEFTTIDRLSTKAQSLQTDSGRRGTTSSPAAAVSVPASPVTNGGSSMTSQAAYKLSEPSPLRQSSSSAAEQSATTSATAATSAVGQQQAEEALHQAAAIHAAYSMQQQAAISTAVYATSQYGGNAASSTTAASAATVPAAAISTAASVTKLPTMSAAIPAATISPPQATSSLPAAFSQHLQMPAMGSLPQQTASQLYTSYQLAAYQMPIGGYSSVQNPGYANMNYLADNNLYASQYYSDGSGFEGALQQPTGGLGSSTVPALGASQIAPTVSTSSGMGLSVSRTLATGGKLPAPGLPPPGITMPGPAAHFMMGPPALNGATYFSPAMYSFDDIQKYSMAYYGDMNQFSMAGNMAGPGATQFAGSDGKVPLLDGQQTMSGSSSTGAAQQAAGSNATSMQPSQTYLGGGGAMPAFPYYYAAQQYNPAVYANLHSNQSLPAALQPGGGNSLGYQKNSGGYASMYAPSAANYDDQHVQEYPPKGMHYPNSQTNSLKGTANMVSLSAGNGNASNGGGNSSSGNCNAEMASSMYKANHGITPVPYTGSGGSHVSSQSAFNPYAAASAALTDHRHQIAAQQQQHLLMAASSLGQETANGNRTNHSAAPASSAKSLGNNKASYSGSNSSWGPY